MGHDLGFMGFGKRKQNKGYRWGPRNHSVTIYQTKGNNTQTSRGTGMWRGPQHVTRELLKGSNNVRVTPIRNWLKTRVLNFVSFSRKPEKQQSIKVSKQFTKRTTYE